MLHADLLWLVLDQSCGGHMHACISASTCMCKFVEQFRVNEAILAGQPPMLASNLALHQDGLHTLQIPRCIYQHSLPCLNLSSEE